MILCRFYASRFLLLLIRLPQRRVAMNYKNIHLYLIENKRKYTLKPLSKTVPLI